MIRRLERAHGCSGNGRYFLVRELVPPAHHKHLALFFRQTGQRLEQFPLGGRTIEIWIGQNPAFQFCVYALEAQGGAHPLPAQPVERFIGGDAPDPGIKAGFSPEGGKGVPYLNIDVLQDVVEHAEAQPAETQTEAQPAEAAATYADGTTLRIAAGYNSRANALTFEADKAGEGVTLADGKTYHTGDLKPTWVEVENLLKIKIEDKFTGAGSATKEFDYWKERLDEVDLVVGGASQLSEYGEEGAIVNLADHLDEMPNFKAYLDANPIVRLSPPSISPICPPPARSRWRS